jgi:hypothetical protein
MEAVSGAWAMVTANTLTLSPVGKGPDMNFTLARAAESVVTLVDSDGLESDYVYMSTSQSYTFW